MNVSVIISNYNYAKYVGSAIDSCLCQAVEPKIIVVDDCSTDGSWSLIKDYAEKHDSIIGVRLATNSKGNARGKNVGICLANTKFVTCLDSDDMLLPGSLEKRIAIIGEGDIAHGFAYPLKTNDSYHRIDTASIVRTRYKWADKVKSKFNQPEPRWAFVMNASAVLTTRSVYDEVGLYDEELRWKIDREMWWRMLSHNKKRVVIGAYVSIYRRHKEQLTGGSRRVWKDSKHCSSIMRLRKESRKGEIDSSNTLMVSQYRYEDFIDEVVGNE